MNRLKKGILTLTTVFCLAASMPAYAARNHSGVSVPITKEKPVSPLQKAFGVVCIATSLFITYKIARLPVDKRGPYG